MHRSPPPRSRPSARSCRAAVALTVPASTLLALTLSLIPARAGAQVCDEDKIAKASSSGAGYKAVSDALCEGIYGRDVSGDVLGFVGLTDRYRLDGYDPIHLEWVGPEGGEVHVRVVTWAEQSFQMDARTKESELTWNPGLLRGEAIEPGSLGFLAWTDDGGERLHVPLRVRQTDAGAGGQYRVWMLPNARLEQVDVTLAKVQRAGQAPTGSLIRDAVRLPQAEFPVGQPFRFAIRHAELPSAGVYYLKIAATQDRGGPVEMSVWFHHGGAS